MAAAITPLPHFLPEDGATVNKHLTSSQLINNSQGQQGVWANKIVCVHINPQIIRPWQHMAEITITLISFVASYIISNARSLQYLGAPQKQLEHELPDFLFTQHALKQMCES